MERNGKVKKMDKIKNKIDPPPPNYNSLPNKFQEFLLNDLYSTIKLREYSHIT